MADQGRWFKLWVSAPDDPDLAALPLDDFARWCKLGAYTKEHGTDGLLKLVASEHCPLISQFQVSGFEAVIFCIKKLPKMTLEKCVEEMQKDNVSNETNTFVTYRLTWHNWRKYQGDFSLDRVRKFREKNRKAVTPKRRREEKRGEESNRSLTGSVPETGRIRSELTVKELVESWNDVCASEGLEVVRDVTPTRERKIRLRLKEKPTVGFWEIVLNKIIRSPFLMGKTSENGWKANIDWLMANDTNAVKVHEGRYDKGTKA